MIKYLMCFALVGCGTGAVEVDAPVIAPVIVEQVAVKISHRGYNENKLDGFIAAIDDGILFLETDLRLRNGEVVLLHNNTSCSDCATLKELLELAQDRGARLLLEFKESAAIDKSLELISQYNVDVVLSSLYPDDLNYINSVSNHSLGLLTMAEYNLTEWPTVDYILINKNHVDLCVDYIKCIAWTLKDDTEYNSVKHKVDFVIFDRF